MLCTCFRTHQGKQKRPPETFNSSSNEETDNESQWKQKRLKLIPEKSLSFAVIGSKKVQIRDEDPTLPILEKTPDGRAYIAEARPHRSKQWKRVHPGIELLSK